MRDCSTGRPRFISRHGQRHAHPDARTHRDTDGCREGESTANTAEGDAGPAGHSAGGGTTSSACAAPHNGPSRCASTSGVGEASGLLSAQQ